MPNVEQTERELPLAQRGIVDNCFEEGHYEYGIGVLDRLRAPRYKPFPLHVRQLIYIALYPPPPKLPNRVNRADAPPPSPQKVQQQRQKDDQWPKPTSRPLSIALLDALVGTNSPESLMRALPHYRYVDNHGVMDVDPFQGDKTTETTFEDNSHLKNEVLALQRLKDCWEYLRGGLVKRKQMDRYRDEDMDFHANSVVGPYAWPMLEWLIRVFEKDERRAEERGQAPHSALLLCQIPPPKSKIGPRWEAEMPIKVACACFLPDQIASDPFHKYASSEKRFDLGLRLILLLANLTSTKPPLLSPSHFLRTLVQHLLELPLASFEAFICTIPLSQAAFKIAVLQGYILQENGVNAKPTQKSKAPAPRAKPTFIGNGAANLDATTTTAAVQDKDKDAYPIPTPDSLLKLLASPLSSPAPDTSDHASTSPPPITSAARIGFAKFQLVSVLCALHISRRLADRDSRWMTAVRGGKLRESVQAGFMASGKVAGIDGDSEMKDYLSQTLEQVRLWETC